MRLVKPVVVLCLLPVLARPASAPAAGLNPKPNCGDASWTILDPKHNSKLFNGTADCTTVESNPYMQSLMGPDDARLDLFVQYDASGKSACGSGHVSVTLSGVKAPPGGLDGPYTAGMGNSPAPSSCEFEIGDLPRSPGVVQGGLKATLARCSRVGGCSKVSDWDVVSVNGSFDAYSRGRGDDN